jgi:4-amino-4-deoxy-L-arabinose transferase-like glycosyltransferase
MRLASRPSTPAVARLARGLLVLVVLVPTAALVASRGFAGMYGQDSFGYVNYALGPLREALLRPDVPPAWPQPPGFPLAIATASLVFGPDGRIGQLISLLAGATVPLTTVLLASETIGPRLTGRATVLLQLLAGLLAGLTGHLWQSSAVAMADTLAIALGTAGAWAACRYAHGGGAPWLLGAAAALSLAIETRWIYGLVAIPVTVVALAGIGRIWRLDRPRALRHVLGAAVVSALILAPVLGPMGVAVVGGDPVPFSADFGAYHWDPGNALRNSFVTPDGTLTYGPTSGLFYALQPVQPSWFGPLGLFAIWGAAWMLRRGPALGSVILVGWPLLVLLFLAGSPYQNTRFFLSAMPPVAVLVALGTWRLAVFIDARVPAPRRRLAEVVAVSAVAVWLILSIVVAARFSGGFIDRQVRDLAAIRAIEARVPASARLISLGPTGAFVYDRVPDVVELYGLTPETALALLGDGRPSYLVIDPSAIDGQWAGRAPALTVEAIRTGRGITAVATEGGWTLYRIGPA